jgi:hypothetical protein
MMETREFVAREATERVRNCLTLDLGVREQVVKIVIEALLAGTTYTGTWRSGGVMITRTSACRFAHTIAVIHWQH